MTFRGSIMRGLKNKKVAYIRGSESTENEKSLSTAKEYQTRSHLSSIGRITRIPYATLLGYQDAHNHTTLLYKVLENIGTKNLQLLYEDTIKEEDLKLQTKEELITNLLESLFDSELGNIEYREIVTSSKQPCGIQATNKVTNKKFAISFKPILQYGTKQANLYRDLELSGKKEFGDFELIIITFKSHSNIIKKYYQGLNIQYIGDLLKIDDEDKLIILPNPTKRKLNE